jgi:hypothetical protein
VYEIIAKRNIVTPSGDELEVHCTEELLVKIRKHFLLPEGSDVQDEYLTKFVVGAIQGAVEKAERLEQSK